VLPGCVLQTTGKRGLDHRVRAVGAAAALIVLLVPFAAALESSPAARGAVACAAPAAADAGAGVLRDGGNAVDAAVATALALAVVHPQAGNLGGGGFAVVRLGGRVAALDFREVAPAAARRDMYLGPDGQPVKERSLVGGLAAGVPGSPAGLYELHRRFGRLSWQRVVAPAEELARAGFVVTARLAEEIAEERALLVRFAATASVWLPHDRPPQVGARMTLPRLADTLAAYAAQGPPAITAGGRAEAIAAAARRLGGIMTAADLGAYTPVWREPVRFSLAGWEVASMPLPSAGGIILAESAGMLERLAWQATRRGSAQRAHLLVEVLRRANADRFLLGDPLTTLAGPADLLSGAWLDRRAGSIDRQRATPSATVRPWPAASESTETTHLSVIDGNGGAVALTTTLNGSFGCGVLVPEVGFLLNNEMDDFAVAPGKPNYYGLVQGEANAVGPGKRMLSSMSPTVAWHGDEVVALGSPGGSHIPSATLQVLLNIILDKDSLREAVDRGRLHHQWQPDRVTREPGTFSAEVAADLTRRGHALRQVRKLGEVHAVRYLPGGAIVAAADRRGPGATAEAGGR
jgi:gamma-glutamyltranspeptidase / glutathione hydrolase